MIEQGRYRGRIVKYGVTRSQTGKKHPTVFIQFALIGRYDLSRGQLVQCPEAERTYFKAVTPNTIDWLVADLKAIGYDKPGLEYLDPDVPGAVNLFGVEIDVDCDYDDYDGRDRERWSIHREPNREKLHRDELATLDAEFADTFKRILGAGKSTVAPAVSQMNTDEPL
jgi:hypothetical protein